MHIAPLRGAGGGGGGSSSKYKRTDDNLFSRDTVELVLGLSVGPIRGLTRGMKSFYVGGTPLMSEGGDMNFQSFNLGVKLGYESDGPVSYKLGGESSNKSVGTKMMSGTWISRQTEQTVRGVIDQLQVRINFQQLYRTDDKGDYNHTAQFYIQYKPASSGWWQNYGGEMVQITGKTTSGYYVDFVFDVPRINDDWLIRVMKVNPDSTNTNVCDMAWDSFQAITKSNRRYNKLALAHIVALATSQFGSIPDFAGVYDGRLIQIPTNYNPDTRLYDEITPWNGTFKTGWTNCPPWILYDLIMNPDYGLRKYYPQITVNRFDFYDAAKWCDTFVPNGKGGYQPRYTFNMALLEAKDGLEMLQWIAGSFGAVIFDDATGQVYLKVDKWEEPKMLFTPENVEGGDFNYSFTDMTTRYNDYKVQFVNPDLDWNQDQRRVYDPTHIASHGNIPTEMVMVGCTDEHEALRRGYYRMITALTETCSVTFNVARLGKVIDPYMVIAIADPTPGWSVSGRIKAYMNSYVQLRDPIYFTTVQNYTMTLQTVDGLVKVVVNPERVGTAFQVKVVSGFVPDGLPDRTVFSIEDNGNFGVAKPFRVMDIENIEGSADRFTIMAIEINRNKQAGADNCTPVGSVQYSFKNPLIPPPPMNIQADSGTEQMIIAQDGSIMARIFAYWDAPPNVLIERYEIEWKESDQSTWYYTTSPSESVFLAPCKSGVAYDIVVWAVNSFGNRSSALTLFNYVCIGKTAPPSNVKNFTIRRRTNDILLQWDAIPDLDRKGYEIRIGTTWETATVLVTDYSATQFAWTTTEGGSYSFLISAIDSSGNYSLLPTLQTIYIQGPSAVTGVIAIQSNNRIELRWTPNPEDNILEYEIREGGAWGTAVFLAKVKSTGYSVTAGSAGTRMFWIKAIASPGVYSERASFVTTDVAQLDDTNIIYTTDEVANGFLGSRYNMVVVGGELRMDSGRQRSEYIFPVTLPTRFRAQNTLFVGLDAIVDYSTTWAQATYPWDDPKARTPWVTPGDISSIGYKSEISLRREIPADVLHSWPLNGTLVSEGLSDRNPANILEQENITYGTGKYGRGLYVESGTPTPTKLRYTTIIPSTFSFSAWVRPMDVEDDVWFVMERGADWIAVVYNKEREAVMVTSTDSKQILIPFKINPGERYLVTLVQGSGDRTLYVGREDNTYAKGMVSAFPIGAITSVRYY
ncbi:hypothetical protein PJWF_00026 [Achromobacter phage JWF]|uniref:central tail fiber J n=1 Tax=Achromobacter phage JWF TaxID=1589748 RepID=UPI000588E12C|nr:central tail fiber J [Achromobacter phage JWF]AJD82920.1 hypothetical protein PJWF_00026 [Achromobacter phage JWF]